MTDDAKLLAEIDEALKGSAYWFEPYKHVASLLMLASDRIAALERQLAEARSNKDAAYLERNQVVAALATMIIRSGGAAGIKRTAIEGWSDDWHGCIFMHLPTGQASWHYRDSHAHLFKKFPQYAGEWDGHTTPEKYERLAAIDPLPEARPIPREPTEAMVQAAYDISDEKRYFIDRLPDYWRAMYDAWSEDAK